MEDLEYSKEELAAMESEKDKLKPPPGLEQRVVNSLRRKKLIQSRPSSLYVRWTTRLAAGVALFLSGMWWQSNQTPLPPQFTHILLLYEDESFNNEQAASHFQEYGAWAGAIKKRGVRIDGEKLGDEEALVGISDPADTSGLKLTGYFVVDVAEMDQAVMIAKESPHIKYGGKIKVRKLAKE